MKVQSKLDYVSPSPGEISKRIQIFNLLSTAHRIKKSNEKLNFKLN